MDYLVLQLQFGKEREKKDRKIIRRILVMKKKTTKYSTASRKKY